MSDYERPFHDECKLDINHEKLAERGLSFDHWDDFYLYAKSLVEYLESHNKNYTKEQYCRICTLKDMCDSVNYGIGGGK